MKSLTTSSGQQLLLLLLQLGASLMNQGSVHSLPFLILKQKWWIGAPLKQETNNMLIKASHLRVELLPVSGPAHRDNCRTGLNSGEPLHPHPYACGSSVDLADFLTNRCPQLELDHSLYSLFRVQPHFLQGSLDLYSLPSSLPPHSSLGLCWAPSNFFQHRPGLLFSCLFLQVT